MVQGVSLSTLATCGKSRICGSSIAPFEPFKRSQITSATGKHFVWNHSVQSLFLIGYPYVSRHSGFKAEAAWIFRGGEQGLDASSEHSESANEDILMFFFQLDLATRVQYALNMEQYDIAQQLRNKLTEVEEEVIKQQQLKRGLSSKSEAQDKALSIIRLRSDLQNAIENEDYALAAEIRDKISKLESESLAASAKALVYENAEYAFRLGQKVRHKKFGYKAVICGMDPVCHESSSWMENAQVNKLSRGSTQPFYQIGPHRRWSDIAHIRSRKLAPHSCSETWTSLLLLCLCRTRLTAAAASSSHKAQWSPLRLLCLRRTRVSSLLSVLERKVLVDVHAEPNLLVAYVSEENLVNPDKPDTGRFDHPYLSFLFYGMDSAGDFIPIKQLREKYNRPRHEIPPNDEDGGKA